jgi:hypothetical protein
MSGYATTHKILRARYFWPSLFNDCIIVIQKCHACQTYNHKIQSDPTPLHPVVSIGPFAKWGIDFMTCHPHLAGGAWIHYCSRRLFYEMGQGDDDI